MQLKLDAVALISADPAASLAFYQLLGLAFIPYGEHHFEVAGGDGQSRLMIDSEVLYRQLHPEAVLIRPSHTVLAFLAADAAGVDEAVGKLRDAGYGIETAPFDAIWGQRYATVIDPDGYRIDIFAPL